MLRPFLLMLACVLASAMPVLAQDAVSLAPEQSKLKPTIFAIVLMLCVFAVSMKKSKREHRD